MSFDAKKVKEDIVKWIIKWFEENGQGCNAIIGISGGKDSSIVAALCAKALGNDKVIGVMLPNGQQTDLSDGIELCELLNIKNYIVNINDSYFGLLKEISKSLPKIEKATEINLPPRLRMSALYAIAQSTNGRVANTCNLSEDWVGYSTRYGDSAGDFSPLSNLTVGEVKAIGRELGLPAKFVDKTPADGLTGKSDEDNLGFTYDVLDRYIREGICEDIDTKNKIDRLHNMNLFKLGFMESFPYEPK